MTTIVMVAWCSWLSRQSNIGLDTEGPRFEPWCDQFFFFLPPPMQSIEWLHIDRPYRASLNYLFTVSMWTNIC
jgi:hypothetical protein